MSAELLEKMKENVIQGRKTSDDIGVDETLTGTPGVVELIEEAIKEDLPASDIIGEGLTAGMAGVGGKVSSKEDFIPDMLASAEAVGAAMDILKPHLEKAKVESKGKFVIATVKGDVHDIGKNIVAILLKGSGFEVVDLGIDVDEQRIVDAVRQEKPDFVGLSALLTTTMTEMSAVIKAIESAGLRDSVKVLIGGAAVSGEYANEIGADAFCADAFQAIRVVEELEKTK